MDKKQASSVYTFITGIPISEEHINYKRQLLAEAYFTDKIGKVFTQVTSALQKLATKGDNTASTILKKITFEGSKDKKKLIKNLQAGIEYLVSRGINAKNVSSLSYESYIKIYGFLTGYKVTEGLTLDQKLFCDMKLEQYTKLMFTEADNPNDKNNQTIVFRIINTLKNLASKGSAQAETLFRDLKNAFDSKNETTFKDLLGKAIAWLSRQGTAIRDMIFGKNPQGYTKFTDKDYEEIGENPFV